MKLTLVEEQEKDGDHCCHLYLNEQIPPDFCDFYDDVGLVEILTGQQMMVAQTLASACPQDFGRVQ